MALVTGAGSGIGKETALRFASEGASVACADLVGEKAFATAAEIGESALGLELDVTSTPSIAEGLDTLIDRYGGLDCIINNAGVTIVGAAHDMPRGPVGQGARHEPEEWSISSRRQRGRIS